jgi:hypothetical protein
LFLEEWGLNPHVSSPPGNHQHTKTISKAWASSPSKGFEKEWRRREIGGGKGEGTAADVG